MRRVATSRFVTANDEGASLMIVLVIVGVLGVLLAGLSSFGATAEITTTAFGGQAGTIYGAGSGINAAITAALNDSTWGVAPDATTSGSCPTLSLPGARTSPAITVQCNYAAGSGFGVTSGGTPDKFVTERPPNSPDYAIVATAQSETGINVGANGTVQVGGPIRSNSPLTTGSGSIGTSIKSILNAGNDGGTPPVPNPITANGTCTGPATNYVPACVSTPTDVGTSTSADNYDTDGNWVTGTMPDGSDPSKYVSASQISGHCGVSKPLSPGIYQDADALNSLINGCNDIVWFKPGVYFFEFTGTSHALAVQNANVHVVGGQLSSTPSKPGSACLTDSTTPAATDGVQWVFGADSRLSVTAGALDLCPIPTDVTTKKQEISIYGLRHNQTFAASAPSTVAASTASDVQGKANFTNEDAGRVIDGTSATYPWPSKAPKTGGIQLSGFDLSSLIAAAPPGSSVSADLEVKYASTSRSFSGLTLTLKDGDGTAAYSYNGTNPCTNSTTTALCQGTTTPTTFDQHFALPGGANATLSGLSSLTAELDANPVNNNGNSSDAVSLDGMKLTVTYTPHQFDQQNGCVTLAAGCGSVAVGGSSVPAPTFFYADGNNTAITVAGSLYAWNASVSINLPNEIGIAFERGAVARTFALNAPASGTAQTVIGLPPAQLIKIPGTPGSTIANDRLLTLKANINGPSGPTVVTAVVDIDPSGKVTVLSWNGKPCGPTSCP